MISDAKSKEISPQRNLKYLLTVGMMSVGKIPTTIKMIFYIFMALWVFSVFGGQGIWYLLLALSILILVRIVLQWEQYMSIIRYAEMKVFGKPLDKMYWKESKPKMPKIVWRKKE